MDDPQHTRSTGDYQSFLAHKRLLIPDAGFTIDPARLSPILFGWQSDICRWSLRRGRAALFTECGTGKSFMQCSWAHEVCRESGGNVLILAPLAVAQQTRTEGAKLGIDVTVCESQSDVRPGISITNYEKLHHFDPNAFVGIVLDECFAPGTLIDTPTGRKHIEDVQLGDKIINASGVDTVADIHRREVPYGIRIDVAGQRITCSPNHPFFTQRGWVGAQDLIPGDYIAQTATAMRMVRDDVYSEVHQSETSAVLRSILLSELANEPTGAFSESPYSRSSNQAWREASCMVGIGQSESASGDGSDTRSQSDITPRSTRKDLPPIESDAPRTFRAWGQRDWFDSTAADATGCTRRELDSGICLVTGQADSGLSHALQDRLGASRDENRYRGGWIFARCSQGSGCKEGCETGFARVDGFEVLESGHPDLECCRDADGKLYFYDLGATQHPSFSVNGLLVHNSSILKAYGGATRNAIVESFSQTPYRLACTATPAPNDFMELGNHAEFLGIMSRVEMLSMFFVHDGGDTSKWRLKGHAESEFWAWLASWAVMLRKPSDLGYSDDGFTLPPLVMHHETVESSHATEGALFPMEAQSLMERRQARRASLHERVDRCVEMVNASDEPWLIWADLNDEADELESHIGDAVQVAGRHDNTTKAQRMLDFAAGKTRVLVSKASIAGHGMNWQHCPNVAFVGLSDSWEMYYQAVRRCWRFGQQRPVHCYIITSESERAVLANIQRKEQDAQRMADEMVKHMHTINAANIRSTRRDDTKYHPTQQMILPSWVRSEVYA